MIEKKIDLSERQIPKWKEKSTFEKGLTVFSLILSVIVTILAVLSLTGSLQVVVNVIEPFFVLLMVTQTVQFWRYNKAVAIFSLIAAIFAFCAAAILFFFQ